MVDYLFTPLFIKLIIWNLNLNLFKAPDGPKPNLRNLLAQVFPAQSLKFKCKFRGITWASPNLPDCIRR